MPSLILLKSPEGAALNKLIPLTGEPQLIGRDAGKCQIVIPHHAISREHAKISAENGAYFIEDMKSRNHTFVNNKEVPPPTRYQLKPDDRIKICDFLFQFRDERVAKPGPLPDWMQKEYPAEDADDDPYSLTTIEATAALGRAVRAGKPDGPHPATPPPAGSGTPVIVLAGVYPPDYLAPEQIHERPDCPLSEATDVHAVGVILFQMLTGQLPFSPELSAGARLEAIVRRRFASCEELCRENGISSRLAALVDRCLRGGEYRQARFLLNDILAATRLPPPASVRPSRGTAGSDTFLVTGYLFEDQLTETFSAIESETRALVNLRLVHSRYDTPDVLNLLNGIAPTAPDAPVGLLRRYRVGRGQPIPVVRGALFRVGATGSGGCLTVVEEYAGQRTLMAAIQDGEFLGDDAAVVRVAVPLLEALDYVHARRAIHARLSPYCIFLPPAGGVKVEGFGPLGSSPPGSGVSLGLQAAIELIGLRRGGEPHTGTAMSTFGGHWRGARRPADPPPEEWLGKAFPGLPGVAFDNTPAAHTSDRFEALLDISVRLSHGLGLESLLIQIVDILFGVFEQADRCFVLLLDDAGRLVPKVVKNRRGGPDVARFSRTIVKKTIESMQAYLTEDASSDAAVNMSASIAEFRIRSMMCVPLVTVENRAVGAIQIDAQDRTKKFSPDDLKLLTAVANLAAIAVERGKLYETVLAREKEQRELELARKVQLGFLPQTLPEVPGYEFYAHYSPSLIVSGDYYDFVPLPGGRVAVIVGDVAGRGFPAGLLVAKLGSEVKLALLTEPNPARAVARLNDQLMQGGIGDRFVTLVVMILEPATHRLTVVNAGHINPKLYTTATRELREVTTNEQTGLPIGIMPEFDYEAVTIELQPGDTIAAFTDGVTEAANPLGEMFGAHRLDQCLPPDTDRTDAGRPCRMGERLVNAVRKHADGRPQNDDIALVCFGRLEPESGPRTLPGPATDLMPRIE